MHAITEKLSNPFLKSSPFRALDANNYSYQSSNQYAKPTRDYQFTAEIGSLLDKNPFRKSNLLEAYSSSKIQSMRQPVSYNNSYPLENYDKYQPKQQYTPKSYDNKSESGSSYTYINKIYDLDDQPIPKKIIYEKIQNPFNRKYLLSSEIPQQQSLGNKYTPNTNYKYDYSREYDSKSDYSIGVNQIGKAIYENYGNDNQYETEIHYKNKWNQKDIKYEKPIQNYVSREYIDDQINSYKNQVELRKIKQNKLYHTTIDKNNRNQIIKPYQQDIVYKQPVFGGSQYDQNSPIKGYHTFNKLGDRKATSQYLEHINAKREEFSEDNQNQKLPPHKNIIRFDDYEEDSPPSKINKQHLQMKEIKKSQAVQDPEKYPQMIEIKGMLFHRIDTA